MFKHLRRAAAAAAVTLAVVLAPVAHTAVQHHPSTPATNVAVLADLARGARLNPALADTFRATILELDSRGTFGVAGSLA